MSFLLIFFVKIIVIFLQWWRISYLRDSKRQLFEFFYILAYSSGASGYPFYQCFLSCSLIDFYSLWNHRKTYGFVIISGRIEVNLFAQIRLILKVKFGCKPLFYCVLHYATFATVDWELLKIKGNLNARWVKFCTMFIKNMVTFVWKTINPFDPKYPQKNCKAEKHFFHVDTEYLKFKQTPCVDVFSFRFTSIST